MLRLLQLLTTTTIMLYLFTVVELLSRALLKVWDLHPAAVRDFILHFSSLTTMYSAKYLLSVVIVIVVSEANSCCSNSL